ncbi:MAG: hypothetical protein COA85_02000 [Robiginitomaculum sp.]|nr:MAG: hypothetical protein COA85_02000 [Robiginitomaculum sp.]
MAPKSKDDGFVLPYVLVVIFILALTSTIAVRSLNSSGRIVTALNADILAEQRLASAEADTLYVFLTSALVKGGVDTSYTPWTGEDILDGFDVSRLPPNAIWSAAGGKRFSRYATGNVNVTYRDISGLVPLNRDAPELLNRLFKGLGLKSDAAKTAAAKLGDYMDFDNRRRFRGGERADYRLKFIPPPSNAQLRAYEEIYHVLGMRSLLSPGIYDRLRLYTTLTPTSTYYRTKFLSSDVARILGLDKPNGNGMRAGRRNIDFVNEITASIETPTLQGRFIFSTPKMMGKIIVRAVEIERTPAAADLPFRRNVVFEETRDASDNIKNDSAKDEASLPVFATPDRTLQ